MPSKTLYVSDDDWSALLLIGERLEKDDPKNDVRDTKHGGERISRSKVVHLLIRQNAPAQPKGKS